MSTLFKNGKIITASDAVEADVLVEGEVVTLIGRNLSGAGHEVVDCAGMYLLPGGIDVHTHLDLPFGGTISNDDFDVGHKAAAFGGTTTHIDFVVQPIGGSLHDGLETWWAKSRHLAQIDYGFHMAVTDLNADIMAEIPTMLDEGITSLKLFMAYKNVFQVDDATLFNTMRVAADNGMIVMVHAENGDVEAALTPALLAEGKTDPVYHASSRPPEIEGEATNRAVVMSGMTGCPLYVVHMTCESAIEALRRGRALGYPVMGETCVQYFFLTVDDHMALPGFEGSKYVCSPPIRSKHDHGVLWQAVRDGTLQIVSTDHCDFWYDGGHGPWQEWNERTGGTDWAGYEKQDPSYRRPGKELGFGDFSKIPNGMPGLGRPHAGHVAGGREQRQIVAVALCGAALHQSGAHLWHVPAQGHDRRRIGRGHPGVGSEQSEHTISAATHHMRVDYNCYEGMVVTGAPVQVYKRGVKLVDGDSWHGENGAGQFVKRAPNAPVL